MLGHIRLVTSRQKFYCEVCEFSILNGTYEISLKVRRPGIRR
jgi:hypothetical protein